VEFRILGPIEALSGGEPLQLGGARQRALLAYLLLHAGKVVSADRLLDELWADSPLGGTAAVQTQVSRLRKMLGDRITTSGRGYVLHLEPGELDFERFRTLLAEAGATPDPTRRSTLLRQADALWRGDALSGLDAPFVAADAAALEELRLGALEERLEADLDRGLDGELVPELSTLVAHHPLRERLRGQLILALYRGGRQADALEAYRETRRVLAEELGLEPGPALRDLEKAILRHDESLGAPAPAVTAQASARPPRTGRRRWVALVVGSLGLVGAAIAIAILALAGGSSGAKRAAPPAARHGSSARSKTVTISDSFSSDYIDPTIWAMVTDGGDVSAAEGGGRLVLTVGPKAVPEGTYDQIDVHAGTQCSFPGDFDARVDYKLLEWPAGDNVWVGLNAIFAGGAVMREATTQFGDIYRSWVTTSNGNVPLPDTSGSMRITRVDGVETTYFWHEGRWRRLASAPSPGAAVFGLGASSGANDGFGHKEVKVAFDNFHVTARNPACPS
jgi:DNA-binding SARP family transcriptional activator